MFIELILEYHLRLWLIRPTFLECKHFLWLPWGFVLWGGAIFFISWIIFLTILILIIIVLWIFV